MKNLGPYKKYIIAAAIIQSIVVVVVGYILFKSKLTKDPLEGQMDEKPVSFQLHMDVLSLPSHKYHNVDYKSA